MSQEKFRQLLATEKIIHYPRQHDVEHVEETSAAENLSNQEEDIDLDMIADAFFAEFDISDESFSKHEEMLVPSISEVDDTHLREEISLEQINSAHRAIGSLANAVSAFPNLFSHMGLFCGHCVAGVGNMTGSVSNLSGGIGGAMGHFHSDGSWHGEDHHKKEPISQVPKHVPASSSSASRSHTHRSSGFRLFPEHSEGIQSLFSFGPLTSISLQEFIISLVA